MLVCTSSVAQDTNEIQIANEYLIKGEKEKALSMYENLSKSAANIPAIHDNYLNLLLDLGKFKDAENYVERIIRKNEDRLNYRLDLGMVYMRSGDEQKADRYFKSIIKATAEDIHRIRAVSDYLVTHNLAEYSSLALIEARNAMHNPTLFTLELANLYR